MDKHSIVVDGDSCFLGFGFSTEAGSAEDNVIGLPLPRFFADELIQGVCLAGLFLDRACSRDEFHGFFAIIPVIIEGVVEGFELFEGDDCE
ncbi:MAG: hypothetical protein ACK57Z_02495, partial [Akkermansiaceae bacterium]